MRSAADTLRIDAETAGAKGHDLKQSPGDGEVFQEVNRS